MNLEELSAATLIALLRSRSIAFTKEQILEGHRIGAGLLFDEAVKKEASGEPISQEIISKLQHLESTTSYQELVNWTVATGKRGRLYQLQFAADDYTHTLWHCTVDGKVKWEDKYLPTATTENWFGTTIRAGKEVKIEAKDDGTSGTIWGAITGVEES